jgi:EF hand
MKPIRIYQALAFLTAATTLTAVAEPGKGKGKGKGPRPLLPIFAAIDTNRDGELSPTEITAAATSLGTLDANGDGTLTLKELRMAMPPRDTRPVPPVINSLDTDHNGTISASELAAAAESLKKLDVNGDGELSPQEIHPNRRPPQGGNPPPQQGGNRPPPPAGNGQ